MKYLETIKGPADLRKLTVEQLKQLADEIRERIIDVVGKGGGHLSSNLGVTEITMALHYCFDFSHDRLLWDVGHQCYSHKLLTGRNDQFDSLRKPGGISGFPSPSESSYDLFDVGHAGTAISTAVGLAQGDQILKRDTRVVAMVGDASIVNGLSFEALNQAGTLKRQFMVILNDNNWGISPTQGAMADHLAGFRSNPIYEELKNTAKQILPKLPLGKTVFDALDHLKEGIKAAVAPHQIFEQLGFMYVGPVDGHDVGHLIDLLRQLGDVDHPVLLHIHTNKGHGADFALAEPGRFHSPRPFSVESGKVTIKKGSGKSWTAAFADALTNVADREPRIFAMTAGMSDGTGLEQFSQKHPDKCQDIGIAESLVVDMAAGMAKSGLKPVVAIYSTFMQRGFDQIFQEVSLQKLPVIFAMDRAGVVGGDGAVHHGFLDISYLRNFPNMILCAPADENELQAALDYAVEQDVAVALRYPRDAVPESLGEAPPFVTGKARLLHDGNDATILAYGASVSQSMDAAELLASEGINVRVYNARFAKPIDADMVEAALTAGHPVITVEEHSISGGFGSAVLEAAKALNLSSDSIVMCGMPADRFIAQGTRTGQLAECGIDAAGIASTVQQAVEGKTQPRVNRSMLSSAVDDSIKNITS